MQSYEVMILYKPLLLEDIKKSTIQKIEKYVTEKEGKLVEVQNMGKRMLAYPINKFEEGHYIEYSMEINPDFIVGLKKELSLMDNILRFLILKK